MSYEPKSVTNSATNKWIPQGLPSIDEEKKNSNTYHNPLNNNHLITRSPKNGVWGRITDTASSLFKKVFNENNSRDSLSSKGLSVITQFSDSTNEIINKAHHIASNTSLVSLSTGCNQLFISPNPEEAKKFTEELLNIQKKDAFTEEEKIKMGITKPTLFEQKSQALKFLIQQKKLLSLEKFNVLIKENPKKSKGIISSGWKALKSELKDNMATQSMDLALSYEEFRGQLVDALNAIRDEALLHMGFTLRGSHSATGTPGYDSDIDTVFIAPREMPQQIQAHVKVMFDELCYELLGGFSGDKIDTESYINHGAVSLKTESHLKHASTEAKREFSRQEDTLACLQIYRAFIRTTPPDLAGWGKYKQDELMAAFSPAYSEYLQEKFSQVEAYEKILKIGIQRQMIRESSCPELALKADSLSPDELRIHCSEIVKNNSKAYQLAEKGYNTTRLIFLSERMDHTAKDLEAVRIEINSKEHTDDSIAGLRTREESLILSLNADDGLRRSHFPESYLTDGAFNRVCFNRGGQIYERKKEEVQRGVRKYSASTTKQSSSLSPSSTNVNETRKLSISSPIISFHLDEEQEKEATIQDTLSSQQENLAMNLGHFKLATADYTDPEHFQRALIATSKYSERTMEATVQLVKQLPSNLFTRQLSPQEVEQEAKQLMASLLENDELIITDAQMLRKQCEAIHFITNELKNCKRKDLLNYNFTRNKLKELLKKPIINPLSTSQLIQEEQELETIVQSILSKSDPLNGELYSDESLTPEDRFTTLLSIASQQGYIEIEDDLSTQGYALSKIPLLNALLKMRAGFRALEKDEELAVHADEQQLFVHIHESARESTLENYLFNTSERVYKFNMKIESLVRQVKNLALNSQLEGLEIPNLAMAGLGLVERWTNLDKIK